MSSPAPPIASPGASAGGSAAARLPSSFADLIEQLWSRGKGQLAQTLHDCVGLVRFAPPEMDITAVQALPGDFGKHLGQELKDMTGLSWKVSLGNGDNVPTLLEQEQARERAARDAIMDAPVVKGIMTAFPDAELLPIDPAEQWSAKA